MFTLRQIRHFPTILTLNASKKHYHQMNIMKSLTYFKRLFVILLLSSNSVNLLPKNMWQIHRLYWYNQDPLKSFSTYSYLAPKLTALIVVKHLVLSLIYLILQLPKAKSPLKKVCKFGYQSCFCRPTFTIFAPKSLFLLLNE